MRALLEAVSYLRSLLVTLPLIYLSALALGSLSLLASLMEAAGGGSRSPSRAASAAGRAQHCLARWWAGSMLFFSRVRVTLRGRELLEPQHTYVFAANHQSYLDIPVLFAYLPAQFRIMAKQVLFRFPVVGWHLRRAGHMPIPRANPRRAARSLLEATDYLNRGISVFVFPEGTRSPDGQLGQFKLGAFLLAIKGGAPVVPVTINGTGALMKLNSWHIRPGRVEMVVHPPIATAGMTSESAEQLCEQARAAIASAIELPAKLLHV